ncbi:unnamed protein product [Brassica oleracea var. botrytis]|uniref:(rape) hypothetical protein n=1 Tax=Brassica napus TaxID=3708 RepID=A0A816TTK5_BRANA|nr:unnamed protein product [Brassica napus]
MNRLRGRGAWILGSAAMPHLKKRAQNSLVALQDSYLSTKDLLERQRVVFTVATSVASVATAWIGYSLRHYNETRIDQRLESIENAMKHTHELERGELKELVDPVGSRFTSTIATAGTTLILGYGLGWRGGIWYANRKFKREQMRLAGQLKPREWKLLLGRIKPRAWPTSRQHQQKNALKTPPPEEEKMGIVPKETIEVTAQSIGITNLSPEAALMLAPDVEYRVREIMQEAIKCMRHSKRTTLTASDVDGALNLRNLEPSYGFASGGPFRFRKAIGHQDLFYTDDREVDFKDVIEAPLPKAPLNTEVVCHWLAIEGVQPAIPENAPLEVIRAPTEHKIYEQKDGPLIDVRLPVKHVLSRELQLYFQKIAELTMSKSSPALFKKALVSLASDSGLHPLVPYFTNFIADEVSRGLNDFLLLFNLMHVVRSLLQNPHIHIEPYLHQLMPSIVTCLVSRKLGNRFADNHWELRDFTANLVGLICKRFGNAYITLQSRLTKTLVNALLDPKKALTQHYGAIQGLSALGHNVVRLLILSNLEPYLTLLEPEQDAEKQKNQMKSYEAWRVYGALLGKGKIISAEPRKRKLSADSSENQSPHKRLMITTDGLRPQDHTGPAPMHVDKPMGNYNPPQNSVQPSSSEQASDGNESESRNGKEKERGKGRSITMKAILGQIWKDDLDSGRLLVKLHQLYGDRILPFIPSTEMSVFL